MGYAMTWQISREPRAEDIRWPKVTTEDPAHVLYLTHPRRQLNCGTAIRVGVIGVAGLI